MPTFVSRTTACCLPVYPSRPARSFPTHGVTWLSRLSRGSLGRANAAATCALVQWPRNNTDGARALPLAPQQVKKADDDDAAAPLGPLGAVGSEPRAAAADGS